MRTLPMIRTCLIVAIALVAEFFLDRSPGLQPVPGQILAQTSQDWGNLPLGNGGCADGVGCLCGTRITEGHYPRDHDLDGSC